MAISSKRSHIQFTIAVVIVSAIGLIYEIALTRLFSLYFQYHFAFLAVSLAILGLSIGAALARYIIPEHHSEEYEATFEKTILIALLLLGLSFIFVGVGIGFFIFK